MNTPSTAGSGIVAMKATEIDEVAGGIAPLVIAGGIVLTHYALVGLYFWMRS